LSRRTHSLAAAEGWPRPLRESAITGLSLLFAFAAGALLMRIVGYSPGIAYYQLLRGGLGSVHGIGETLVRFCPLGLCALAVAVGFRAAFFTIGVEGQFYLGALGSTATALGLPHLPAPILLPLAMAAGAAAGSAWALLAGWLKVRLRVNEVIGTLMLNYIAVLLVAYLVRGPLRAAGSDTQYTALIPAASVVPRILPGARVTWTIVLPLLAALGVHLFLRRSWAGFSAQAQGLNPAASRYAGIDLGRSVLTAAGLSGALAGLAGAAVIQGEFHRLQIGVAADYGYTAIPIALVGNTAAFPTLLAALLFACLDVGATLMQLKASVPYPVVKVLEGIVILSVAGLPMLPWARRFRSGVPHTGGPPGTTGGE
jgi:general nucleoside transport system permease protein